MKFKSKVFRPVIATMSDETVQNRLWIIEENRIGIRGGEEGEYNIKGDMVKMFQITRQAALKEIGKLVDLEVVRLVGQKRGARYVLA